MAENLISDRESLIKRAAVLRITTTSLASAMQNGTFRSLYHGQGIEFAGVREYLRGDDVRTIDWNVTARSGKPFVKLFDEERELQIFLIVDRSLSMQEGTKNKKITEKLLREAIQKRRSQIAEKTAPPEPRRLRPTTPAERLKEEAQRGIKIVDYDKEEAETKEQRKAQAAIERIELMPGDLVKVPEKVNRDPDFFSSAVIKQFSDMIKQFPRHAEPLLQGWLDQLIKSQGKEAVATMLQKGAAEGHVVNREIAYSMDKIQTYISDMLNYLPEMTDWYKAEIMEQFETFDAF